MSRADLAAKTCSLARAVEIVGDGWTLMILREMFLGVRRFDEFQRQTGASPALVSGRLRKMEEAGLIRRIAYSEHPPRFEYRLTDMGKALWPAIIALKTWGDDWVEGPVDGTTDSWATPVEIIHKSCGAVVAPQMTCPDCGEAMAAHDAHARLSAPFFSERRAAQKAPTQKS
jgi:DNA-binding HxlR family transcriptional regulator/predicted RNA-binding Zn-ribbon protein involved in translation (DUF1610 family)